MKVERKDPGFRPVVITLESQEELDALWKIHNAGTIHIKGLVEHMNYQGRPASPEVCADVSLRFWSALDDVS